MQACAECVSEYSLFTLILLFLFASLAAIPDRQATFVFFKLIVNQPAPQWSLFLRVSILFIRSNVQMLFIVVNVFSDSPLTYTMPNRLYSLNDVHYFDAIF